MKQSSIILPTKRNIQDAIQRVNYQFLLYENIISQDVIKPSDVSKITTSMLYTKNVIKQAHQYKELFVPILVLDGIVRLYVDCLNRIENL